MRSTTTGLAEQVRPTATESVRFRDGMLVTADDLDAAMRYPEDLLHTVLRAYFGRGVVCGLELSVEPSVDGRSARPGEPTGGGEADVKARARWVVCVSRGVAIDCDGHPVELCGPVRLDLTPDPCATDATPEGICIAIRRVTSDEVPRDPCACDAHDGHRQCSRVRDHVVVAAFDRAHFEDLHSEPKPKGGSEPSAAEVFARLCSCHATCPPRACGDGCWIVLGCLEVTKDGGIAGEPNLEHRHRVRPVQCLCDLAPALGRLADLADRVAALEERLPAPRS